MTAPEQEQEDGARAARELTQQAQELGLYDDSALDRVLLALWKNWLDAPLSLAISASDILAAQKELDRLRADLEHWRREYREVVPTMDTAYHAMQTRALRAEADLADVARLEAWLRERPFYRDVSWGRGAFRTFDHGVGTTAPSLPALGAAVATEGT